MSKITKTEMREKLGNIKQLQELLFGEQIKEYNQKFDSYYDKINHLESNYQQSQLVLDKRLKELEDKLVAQITLAANALEKKIQYLNLTSKEEHQQIKQDLDFVSQQTRNSIDYLQDSIKIQNSNLKSEINQTKIDLGGEIGLLKQQITDKLNSSLSDLSKGKVSRSDLAEVLFELCLKLKEPNINFEAIKEEENIQQTNMILPEENHQE